MDVEDRVWLFHRCLEIACWQEVIEDGNLPDVVCDDLYPKNIEENKQMIKNRFGKDFFYRLEEFLI